jgi:hypothetical protein
MVAHKGNIIEKILCIWSIWLWGHYLSGICSVYKLFTIVTTSKFCIVWGSKSITMSGIMLEPGLVDSACQCFSAHCCVSAAIFDVRKHGCTSHPPSLPDLVHVIFSFLRMKSQLCGCHFQNLELVHGHPTCYSNKLLAVLSAVCRNGGPTV